MSRILHTVCLSRCGTRGAYSVPSADPISVPPDPKKVGSGPSDHGEASFRPARPRKEGVRPSDPGRRSFRPARPPTGNLRPARPLRGRTAGDQTWDLLGARPRGGKVPHRESRHQSPFRLTLPRSRNARWKGPALKARLNCRHPTTRCIECLTTE